MVVAVGVEVLEKVLDVVEVLDAESRRHEDALAALFKLARWGRAGLLFRPGGAITGAALRAASPAGAGPVGEMLPGEGR